MREKIILWSYLMILSGLGLVAIAIAGWMP